MTHITPNQNTAGIDPTQALRALPEGSKRKPYRAPELTLHGDVTEITQQYKNARDFFLPYRGVPHVS